MFLYPAIDLKGGECVRLLQGDMTKAVRFNASPAAQAKNFKASGFSRLHLVDLDGAIAGKAINGEAVRSILDAVDLPVQLGGGIRDLAAITAWLEGGVARVILGTVALEEPELVREAARRFPGQIAVGIDARDGRVAVRGWVEATDVIQYARQRRW